MRISLVLLNLVRSFVGASSVPAASGMFVGAADGDAVLGTKSCTLVAIACCIVSREASRLLKPSRIASAGVFSQLAVGGIIFVRKPAPEFSLTTAS